MNTDRLCDRLWKGKQGAPLALLSPLVRKLTQELTPSRRFAVCGHCSAVSRMEMPLASSGAWAPVGSDPRRGAASLVLLSPNGEDLSISLVRR